jgi:hypothetical protein
MRGLFKQAIDAPVTLLKPTFLDFPIRGVKKQILTGLQASINRCVNGGIYHTC